MVVFSPGQARKLKETSLFSEEECLGSTRWQTSFGSQNVGKSTLRIISSMKGCDYVSNYLSSPLVLPFCLSQNLVSLGIMNFLVHPLCGCLSPPQQLSWISQSSHLWYPWRYHWNIQVSIFNTWFNLWSGTKRLVNVKIGCYFLFNNIKTLVRLWNSTCDQCNDQEMNKKFNFVTVHLQTL